MSELKKINGPVNIVGELESTSLDINGNAQIDGTVTVGVNDTGYDVTFFGDDSGEYMFWDTSSARLEIKHTDENAGLEVYTNAGASTSQPQLKVGRSSAQYWGVYTDDRNAHLVHRQDETSGTMTTRFDQWDSNTSDTNGEWLWRYGNGSGGSMATALTLTQAGNATFAGEVEATSLDINGVASIDGDVTITSQGLATSPVLRLNNSASSSFNHALEAINPNLTATETELLLFGKATSSRNSGFIGYNWNADNSNNNYVTIGHWGYNHLLKIFPTGNATFAGTVLSDGILVGQASAYSPTGGGDTLATFTGGGNDRQDIVVSNQTNHADAAASLVLATYGHDFIIKGTSSAGGSILSLGYNTTPFLSLTNTTATFAGNIDFSNNKGLTWAGSHSIRVESNILKMAASSGIQLQNNTTVTGNLTIPEYIYHTSDSNTLIGFPGNDRVILHAGGNSNLELVSNSVALRYNGGTKLETVAGGVLVTGELEATTLDINGAADISGALTVGGSVFTLTAPDAGSAPAMTATLNMRGYEGRGIGVKMRPHVTSAANATNAEWFMGSGYGQSGFNVGYAADGSQSSYSAQNKFSLSTSGNAIFAGNIQAANAVFTGNLTVNGTTTTVNQTNLDVSDNIIGLNRGASSNGNDSGIIIERGSTGDNAAILYDESIDYYVFGLTTATASATGNIALSTFTGLKAGEGVFTSLDINGNADISGNITSASWTGDVIGSAYLDADTTHNSVAQTSTAMKSFEVALTDGEDWASSPISILEKGNVNAAQSADKYAPNLNFHWGAVVSNSLWMGHNGHLNYGNYSSAGVPAADGVFNIGALTSTGKVTGTELEGTSLDINGAANISGSLLVATATDYYSGCQIGVGDTSDSQNGLSITTSTTGNAYLLFGDGTGTSSYIGQIRYAHNGDFMDLQTGGGVRLKLNAAGATVTGSISAPSSFNFTGNNGYIKVGSSWNTGTLSFLNGSTTYLTFDVPNGRIQNNLGSYLTASSGTAKFGSFDNQSMSLVTNNTARLTIDTSGNSTFTGTLVSGNITTASRITFDSGGDHYLESGTNTWNFKNASGTTALQLNHSSQAATFAGNVIVTDGSDTTTLTSSGITLSRSNSYIQSNADNSDTLNIGQSSVRWGHVKVDGADFAVYNGGNERFKINSSGNATFAGTVSAEDNIHLTDAGTVRAKLLLNASDRDNVELRAESLGSTMKFFTVGTEALGLDASQNATFANDLETKGSLSIRNGSSNHQVRIQATVGGTSRIMAHNGNIGTNHDLDIVSTQIDLKTGSISGSANGSALLLDSSKNATFAGTISGTTITATNSIVIPDSGTIGSASDTDAIAIEDDGSVLFSSHIEANGNIIFDGNTITGVNDSGEFDDDDAHIMTSAGINDRFAVINANTTGSSGSCTGLAATATALATARDIGGVSFNGTAAINLPGVNTAGNQNTSGTAAIATTVTVADESSDTSCNVLFATAATGNLGPKSGTNLTFNSSSGVLTATGFAGALTGNVTGNASGSSGSCTGNAATATLAATSTIASDTGSATHFPVFVDGSTGARALKAHSAWNYNPGTETLTAGKLATDVASIVEDNKSNSALMTLTGQGAGDEGNVSLKMLGTSAGNPIKLKMAGLDDGGSQVGAGFLSYDAEDDSFGIGQSSSHNRMGVKIENTISLSSPNVHYEPVSIKAREYVASANSTHYDFYGDIIRNGNDTTVRGKMYCYKNGTWTISNADTKLDANGMLGIAIGTNSTTHGMLLKGTYTLDYDPGSNGNPLYVSATDGLLSITVPSTSGHIVRLVGYLLGGTHGNIFFNPDSTYVEVA
jgi:hypothetical protein